MTASLLIESSASEKVQLLWSTTKKLLTWHIDSLISVTNLSSAPTYTTCNKGWTGAFCEGSSTYDFPVSNHTPACVFNSNYVPLHTSTPAQKASGATANPTGGKATNTSAQKASAGSQTSTQKATVGSQASAQKTAVGSQASTQKTATGSQASTQKTTSASQTSLQKTVVASQASNTLPPPYTPQPVEKSSSSLGHQTTSSDAKLNSNGQEFSDDAEFEPIAPPSYESIMGQDDDITVNILYLPSTLWIMQYLICHFKGELNMWTTQYKNILR